MRIDTYRVFVEDLDRLDVFHCPTVPVAADGGIFDALDIQLHRFRIDLAAVVKQHAFAQPEHPRGELLIGLPALGNARDNVTLLIDIGQAGVHGCSWMGGVQLIMTMRIEAGSIVERAELQHATSLWMPLCRLALER